MGCHTNDGILGLKRLWRRQQGPEDDCSSAHRFFTSQVFLSIAKSLNSVIPSGAHGKTLHAWECSARSRGTPRSCPCHAGLGSFRYALSRQQHFATPSLRQVLPAWIHLLDERNLLISSPPFDLFFSGYGFSHVIKRFVVNQPDA